MKNKIMNVSIPLFGEKGYRETSIQDIVNLLGVTKGTFYYYYKSKQELLRDINVNFIEYMLEQQQFILADSSTSYEQKIHQLIYMVISSIRTRKQNARTFIREIRHMEESNLNEVKQKRKEFKNNLQYLIEDGIKAGEFKNHIRADMITLGILGMTNWTYYWYNPEEEVTEEEIADIFMEMIRTGIK